MAIELKEIEITDPEYTKEPAWVIKKTSVVPGDETPFYLVKQFYVFLFGSPGGMNDKVRKIVNKMLDERKE